MGEREGGRRLWGPPRVSLKSVNRGSTSNLADILRRPLGTVILAVMPDAVICYAILLPLFSPISGGSRRHHTLFNSDWRGIRDFLFVACWPFRASPGPAQVNPVTATSGSLRCRPVAVNWLCSILATLLEPTHWAHKSSSFLQRLNRSVVALEMLFAKACKAQSGLVCVATWNFCRITSESSSVFWVACSRMTSRVTSLCSQTASNAQPLTLP